MPRTPPCPSARGLCDRPAPDPSLPAHLDGLERLAELEWLILRQLDVSLPQSLGERLTVTDLAHMSFQGMDLGIEVVGDVDDEIGRFRAEVPDLRSLVWLQAGFPMLGKVEWVAGQGVDAIVSGDADGPMIGVECVGSDGGVGTGHVRPELPDQIGSDM